MAKMNEPLPCVYCGETFKLISDSAVHHCQATKESLLSESDCSDGTYSDLEKNVEKQHNKHKHLFTSFEMKCFFCHKKYDTLLDSLIGHKCIDLAYIQYKELQKRQKESDLIICWFCKIKFNTVLEKLNHICTKIVPLNHLPQESYSEVIASNSTDHVKVNKDEVSMVKSETRNNISEKNSKRSIFSCRICGRNFTMLRLLNRHELCHSLKPYKCEVCEWRFPHVELLQRHMKVHISKAFSKNAFLCNECGQPFSSIHMLHAHSPVCPARG